MNKIAIGIDLGTTYSAVAYLDDAGRPATLPNGSGEQLTPSAVLIDEDEIVVGREAVRASVVMPGRYAECFKRELGHRQITANDVDTPPEVFSALVLERLWQDAQQRLGAIESAVITVPAFFDEGRRFATREAARLAGIHVLDIINEPTAAAVAYGFAQRSDTAADQVRRVVVYDLGGGTFDVTILEINGQNLTAIATDGDVRLGGKDFDSRLVDYLATTFQAEHGVDPRSDPEDCAQLWMDAESVKQTLTERAKSSVVVTHAGLRSRVEITRPIFEELTRDLIERTEITLSLVVKDAGLTWDQIDDTILVGGSSRMPMVTAIIEQLTGKPPCRTASPDEAVAHGAALYAGTLLQQNDASHDDSWKLVNVNSHTLGVVGFDPQTKQRRVAPLIPRNTQLPAHNARAFKTAKPGQRSVKVQVVEGESEIPENCVALGECIVRDLPAELPKGSKIHVDFRYDSSGRLSVAAKIADARSSAHVIIQRSQTMVESLDRWRERLLGIVEKGGKTNDSATPLEQLDELHVELGQAMCNQPLPPELAPLQQNVLQQQQQLQLAKETQAKTQLQRDQAPPTQSRIALDSEFAQAANAATQIAARFRHGLLMLGREYAQHPESGAGQYAELVARIRGKIREAEG